MNRLRDIRVARKLSQAALAERIGVTEGTVSRYETKPERLTLPKLEQLARALDCRVSDITGETELDQIGPPGDNARAFRSRAAIAAELARLDDVSVRLLREWACAHDDAPERLRAIDAYADELRRDLESAI